MLLIKRFLLALVGIQLAKYTHIVLPLNSSSIYFSVIDIDESAPIDVDKFE